jgi:hypothetical protein
MTTRYGYNKKYTMANIGKPNASPPINSAITSTVDLQQNTSLVTTLRMRIPQCYPSSSK